MPLRGHSAGKAALLRRFNFLSERVLNSSKMAAINDDLLPAALQNGGNLLNGNGIHAPGQNEQHIFVGFFQASTILISSYLSVEKI